MQFVKAQNNQGSYLNWEIFVRERELASYKLEKDRRQNLYQKLQKIISECKEEANQTKEKLEFLIQEKLFGDVDVDKLALDYKIPPQHNIQFYLKARKPSEFELYYKDSEYYLTKLIRRTNKQLEYLHHVKSSAKLELKYERRNYMRFLGPAKNAELEKKYKEMLEYDYIYKNHNERIVLYKIHMQNKQNEKQISCEIKILKAIDDHIKANKYSKFNLTAEQKEELNRIRKAEILRNELLEKAKSEEEILQKFKAKQGDSQVYFHKNNVISDVESFNLTYNQKMLLLNDRNSLTADLTKGELQAMANDIKKMDADRKIVKEITKRKEVTDSLRRRKRYHLPEVKRMKTSLDKYDDEEMYYLVRSYKENDINSNKSAKGKVAFNDQQFTPKI